MAIGRRFENLGRASGLLIECRCSVCCYYLYTLLFSDLPAQRQYWLNRARRDGTYRDEGKPTDEEGNPTDRRLTEHLVEIPAPTGLVPLMRLRTKMVRASSVVCDALGVMRYAAGGETYGRW